MYLALLLLLVLVVWFAAIRLRERFGVVWPTAEWSGPQRPAFEWWLVSALALAAQWPLLLQAPLFLRPDAVLLSDAPSHAAIIRALAERGAPHGWIDVYDGGFPLAVNYPFLGWVVTSAIVRLGMSVTTAIQLVGLLPYVLMPVAVVQIARTAGARPLPALAGALVLAWIAPYNSWLGNYETFVGLGLLSQAVVLPCLLGVAWAAIARRHTWALPVLGACVAAAHPQIAVMSGLYVLPLLFLVSPRVRTRLVLAIIGCGLMGVAIYGPGLAHHRLPFAWLNLGEASWISGYKVDRIVRWTVDFELFDQHRDVPLITAPWLLCVGTLVILVRRRVPRLFLAAMVWALALSMLGRALLELSEFGQWALSFLQPQRAFSLVPLAMAATVVVAVEEIWVRAEALGTLPALGGRGPLLVSLPTIAVLAALAVFAPSIHADRLGDLSRTLAARLADDGGGCPGMLQARDWVSLLDRGRLSTIEKGAAGACAKALGVELRSPIPLGLSAGAGSHVGMLTHGFLHLRPKDAGIADRAEAMGVRWLIHDVEHRPIEGFEVMRSSGAYELSRRVGGTDLVGVGCVEEAWRGSNRALRIAMGHDLEKLGGLVHPRRLVVVEETQGDVVVEPVDRDGCDAAAAVVSEVPREPGAHEAVVESPRPVDVVVRSTAFATWTIAVDEHPTPWRSVGPGFMAVRVPAGRHHVVATASWPRYYAGGLLAAAALVVAVGVAAGRRPRTRRPRPIAVISSPR